MSEPGQGGLSLAQAAERLGVHYMTVYRYVRTGRLPARRSGAAWTIDPTELEAFAHRGDPVEPGDGPTTSATAPASQRLVARMVAGDERGAWSLLEAELASGRSPEEVLLELLAPALRSIGHQWEAGEIGVADEHRASAVASRIVARLGARFAPRGRKRGTVILAAPPGELHAAPVAIASDLLRWRGYEVAELGANTPTEALIELARRTDSLLAIGIAVTTHDRVEETAELLHEVRAALPGVPLLLGGAGIADEAAAQALGADYFTGSTGDGLVRVLEAISAR